MAANAHLGAPKLGMLPMGPSGSSYAYVCASCDLGFPATTSSGGELTTCPSCAFPLPASLQRLAAWNMIRYVLPFSCTSSRTRAAPSAVSLPDSSSKKRTRAHMSGMGMDKIPDTPPSQIVGGQQQNAQQLVVSQNGQAGEQTSELETTAKAAWRGYPEAPNYPYKSLIATIVASVEEACGEREEGKQAKCALTELPGSVERAKARCADYASARSAFDDATRTRTLALADASALGNATVERSLTLWCDAHVDRALKKLQGTVAPFRELAELCTTIVAGVAETVTHDDDAANAALARAMPLLAGLHRFAFRA